MVLLQLTSGVAHESLAVTRDNPYIEPIHVLAAMLAQDDGPRALLERVFPKEEITEELRSGFVCVAADSRTLPAEIASLLASAPKKEPTPVCLYALAEPSGVRLLFSTAGGRPPAVFIRDLTDAHARH